MFGGFIDPSQSPEVMRGKGGEKKEPSQAQKEMADKWATAMAPETSTELPLPDDTESGQTTAGGQQSAGEAQPTAGIQHFTESELEESSFDPLPPEEQLAADAKAADANAAERVAEEGGRSDSDNLVAEAVAEASQDGNSVDLNDVGAKLEQNGVPISDEAEKYEPDIARDVQEANSGNDDGAPDPENVSNLAIDAGVKALSLKEDAARVAATAKQPEASSGATLDTQIADFQEKKAAVEELTKTAESAANEAGVTPTDTIDEANAMIGEAQEIVDEAQKAADTRAEADAAAEEAATTAADGETPDDSAEKSASQPAKSPETISTDIFEDLASVGAPKEAEATTEKAAETQEKAEEKPLSMQFTAANYPELADLDAQEERKKVFTK